MDQMGGRCPANHGGGFKQTNKQEYGVLLPNASLALVC
jgi:hypothetical protein